MEEFLILVFQFLFEIVLQVLAELPWDIFMSSKGHKGTMPSGEWFWIGLSLILGGAIGAASLWVRPNTYLKHSLARVCYLFLAPLCSAWISRLIAKYYWKNQPSRFPAWLYPVCASCFAFAFALIRFTYAKRL